MTRISPQDHAQPRAGIHITLTDGTIAELRPVSPEDRPLLEAGFEQLSEESRFARFGIGLERLSESELAYLSHPDHVSHVAWGALVAGQPAGVGRYFRLDEGDCAEVAVAVVDRYQGRGLGRALLAALAASARESGIAYFCFAVGLSNRPVLSLLARMDAEMDILEGAVEGRIAISSIATTEHDRDMVDLLAVYRREL